MIVKTPSSKNTLDLDSRFFNPNYNDTQEGSHEPSLVPEIRSDHKTCSDGRSTVTYSWKNVHVIAKSFSLKRCLTVGKESAISSTHILKNVTGVAEPGILMAVMGSSGAGKSTLMNVLTFRNSKKLHITGKLCINGLPANRELVAGVSAYIQQNDVFVGTLTPREHLQFHASLRTKGVSKKERKQIVNDILHELGLTKCADTLIGIPGLTKGISGGQKKRLSIATELITDPAILFCDEPTTGLDTFMALNVIKCLKQLTMGGKAVVCSIHQPNSLLYELFDRLLLMAEGRVAYLGHPSDALDFFSWYHRKINPHDTIMEEETDFFLRTLAIRPNSEEKCRKRANAICNSFEKSIPAGIIQKMTERNMSTKCTAPDFMEIANSPPYRATWFKQFLLCTWRSWKVVLKDPLLLKIQLVQTLGITFLIGGLFWDQKLDQQGLYNMSGFLFITVCFFSLSTLVSVVHLFWHELPVFLTEHTNGAYRVDSYFLGKTTGETPAFTCLPLIYIFLAYWCVGVNRTAEKFFIAALVGILCTAVGSSIGYMVSTCSPTFDTAMSSLIVITIPYIAFGGHLLHKNSIPWYCLPFKYTSWFLHGFEILSVNQWHDTDTIECPTSRLEETSCVDYLRNKTLINSQKHYINHTIRSTFPCENITPCVRSGQEFLDYLGFREEDVPKAFIILTVIAIVTRIMSFVGVWLRAYIET